MGMHLRKGHFDKESNKMDFEEKAMYTRHKYALIERNIDQTPVEMCKQHCRFLTSRPLINVKYPSRIKKKRGITQKLRNGRDDEYFHRRK